MKILPAYCRRSQPLSEGTFVGRLRSPGEKSWGLNRDVLNGNKWEKGIKDIGWMETPQNLNHQPHSPHKLLRDRT